MIYFYRNNDKDFQIIYFAYTIHVFWMQNIFSGQSGKKLDKVSRDPRTGKGIIMVKYHVPTLYHVENYCRLVYSLNLCKEWCIFDDIFQPYKRGIPMLSVYGEGWRWSWMVEILTSTNDSRLLNKSVLCLDKKQTFCLIYL